MSGHSTHIARARAGRSALEIWLRRAGVPALGLGVVGWLVHNAGLHNVAHALDAARWAVGISSVLELGVLACDALAARALVGPRVSLARRRWLRGSALAYAAASCLPSGRAAGELVRAAALSPELGAVHATQTGARLQGVALLANAAISAAAVLSIALGMRDSRALWLALGANALACGALGAAVLFFCSHPRTSNWLSRLLARLPAAQGCARAPVTIGAGAQLQAFGYCCAGRVLQTLEHAALLYAVGGALGVVPALASQGIALVGAAVGDFMPAQLGAVEGSYRVFAGVLGLADEPASVLVIALGSRLAQLLVSALCACGAMLLAPAGASGQQAAAQNINPSAT